VTLADVPVVVADKCSSRVDCLSCFHVCKVNFEFSTYLSAWPC
jgi:hypothetical protein